MFGCAHKLLYRLLPLEGYLRVVSGLYFAIYRLGLGRGSRALEYAYHLPALVERGATAVDIGANLGYYSRPLARIVGAEGTVYAVEPMTPVFRVLQRNLRHCANVRLVNAALGEQNRKVTMANTTTARQGYFGTGQNFVADEPAEGVTFEVQMLRGSALFGVLERLDFIKCDIEGYELTVMCEMREVLERFHPTVLIETGGANRPLIIELFTALGYTGYTLQRGEEVASTDNAKDIIFRYNAN